MERRAVGKLGAQVNSYSQAGQDRFVRAVHGDTPGFFLDVGCSDPVHISNTYALEKLGWRGLLVTFSRAGHQYSNEACKPILVCRRNND